MWEIILFIITGTTMGWYVRGMIDRKTMVCQQKEKPEMMWFNNQKSQWERVTKLQLLVATRVVVEIPVKLVEEKNNGHP